MKTFIPVLVETSCSKHPHLPAKLSLPHSALVALTPMKLFGYAAMKLQDAAFQQVRSYEEVRPKATTYIGQYSHLVTYDTQSISVGGDVEARGQVSELLGIGVGLAAYCKVFGVNPNRVSRFITRKTGKRMDFEVVARGKRCSLEVRGTGVQKSRASLIKAVGPKKKSPLSKIFAAHAGAVTLHSQGNDLDHVTIVDPPGEGGDSGELDELAAILEYYQNVYRLTHTSDAFSEAISDWVRRYRDGRTGEPPPPLDRRQLPRHRVSDDVDGVGLIRGTIYDLRVTRDSVARYRTFEEASRAHETPTWLLGTTPELDEIVARGRWMELLGYSVPQAGQAEESQRPSPADGVLPSGFAVVPTRLSDDETIVLRRDFQTQRHRYEARAR